MAAEAECVCCYGIEKQDIPAEYAKVWSFVSVCLCVSVCLSLLASVTDGGGQTMQVMFVRHMAWFGKRYSKVRKASLFSFLTHPHLHTLTHSLSSHRTRSSS